MVEGRKNYFVAKNVLPDISSNLQKNEKKDVYLDCRNFKAIEDYGITALQKQS